MEVLRPQAQRLGDPGANALDGQIFTIGTLRYTKGALWLLFSWLMWNDLCLMLMEHVAPSLVPLLFKDNGATNAQIAFYGSTLTGAFTIWINPVVSTWSDRYRSRAGRRRPFLFFATPFCAIALASIPFMPDFFRFLQQNPSIGPFLSRHASIGVVTLIGLASLFYQVFNSVILAIFTYYFWDVVPESVLGRFSALTKIVGTIAVFIWKWFLFGESQKHMKAVFVGVAIFFFTAYMISLWQVKEGEYPPPPVENKRRSWTVIGSYFQDCYKPYYLWFILANTVYQLGNVTNNFQIFLFRDQLHLDLFAIGRMQASSTIWTILIVYPMGTLIDRLKPGRVLIVSVFLYGIINLFAFMFLNGQWSLFLFSGLIALIICPLQIAQGVFTVEFFPRAKLGQFCSANALMSAVTGMIAAPFVGRFFDWLKDYQHVPMGSTFYRYAFLWSCCFYFLSLPLYLKCYLNWRKTKVSAEQAEPEWDEPPEAAATAV